MSISSNALKVIPQVPSAGINVDFGATVNNKIYKVECDIDYGTTTSGNNLQVYIYNANSGSVSNLSSYNIPGSGHCILLHSCRKSKLFEICLPR